MPYSNVEPLGCQQKWRAYYAHGRSHSRAVTLSSEIMYTNRSRHFFGAWRGSDMASRLMAMDSPLELPAFLRDPSEGQPVQRDLFGEPREPELPSTGLFAEIVFDRPLDHAYTYAV